MDWDKRDSTQVADSSHPQPRFVRNRPRRIRVRLQFSLAATVLWAPLVVAFYWGIAPWLGFPLQLFWLALLSIILSVPVAAIIQWMSPRERRVFVGIITGIAVAALIGAFVVCLVGAHLEHERLEYQRLTNSVSKREWTGVPVIIVFVCTVPVMLGAILGQWWAWKRGDT